MWADTFLWVFTYIMDSHRHYAMNDNRLYAQQCLLAPFDLNSALLDKTLLAITQQGIDYADIYCQQIYFESWALEESQVKSGHFHIDQGFGIRAVSDEKTALTYSSQINPKALHLAAESVKAIRHHNQSYRHQIPEKPVASSRYASIDPIKSLDSIAKINILEKVDRIARKKDPRIIRVMAQLVAKYEIVYIANHQGQHRADIRPLVRLSIQVIAKDQHNKEEGSSGGGGRVDLTYFDDKTIEYYTNLAVDKALLNLKARPAPAGQMTVVLGSGWPGILLHEAIGHGLEGDFHRKGVSAFTNAIGKKIAATGVTVVDNGTLMNKRGSLTIDDEGQTTQNTVLIEKGILKNILQDITNAKLMKTVSTGNGRRESYAAAPMPRMTNTYMLNGQYEANEIIASVKNGFYAANFNGGEVDITSGRFVFSASEAWRIENGRLSYPVKGATLIGNGSEILQHISMIGNDLTLDDGVGVCGKNGQSVPVGVGQPTLRIDSGLTVGGITL